MNRSKDIIKMYKKLSLLLISLSFAISGCAATHSPELASQCARGLDSVSAEYEAADNVGLSGSASLIKAAALIAAPKIQQQFDKYPNCINKVQRARVYIRQAVASSKGKK